MAKHKNTHSQLLPTLLTMLAIFTVACLLAASNVYADGVQMDIIRDGTPPKSTAIRKESAPAPNVGRILAKNKKEALKAQQEKQAVYDRWHNPTGGVYPDVSNAGNLHINVDLASQRVLIMDGDRILYTMIASAGMDDSTPHGDYRIGMRGENFYNPDERMGANYWTGFIGSTYLFHTVPTDANNAYIESEAVKLGQPASHGCVRLSISDAKWIHDVIPSGTPVHIG